MKTRRGFLASAFGVLGALAASALPRPAKSAEIVKIGERDGFEVYGRPADTFPLLECRYEDEAWAVRDVQTGEVIAPLPDFGSGAKAYMNRTTYERLPACEGLPQIAVYDEGYYDSGEIFCPFIPNGKIMIMGGTPAPPSAPVSWDAPAHATPLAGIQALQAKVHTAAARPGVGVCLNHEQEGAFRAQFAPYRQKPGRAGLIEHNERTGRILRENTEAMQRLVKRLGGAA